MPFFRPTYSHPAFDLHSLFDQTFPTPTTTSSYRSTKRAFSPNFDVHENAGNYILEGEVPGLENKDNIEIEFTDERTLSIRGRIERSRTRTSEPTAKLDAPEEKKSTENTEKKSDESVGDDNDWESVKEPETEKTANGEKPNEKPTEKEAAPAEPPVKKAKKSNEPKPKYWISERSVGEFARSFSFPEPVNVEAVTAKLENGILTVVVPKTEKKGARKIAIA